MRCTATVLLAFKGKEFSSSAMISFVTSLLPTSYLTGWWALNMNLLCRLLQGFVGACGISVLGSLLRVRLYVEEESWSDKAASSQRRVKCRLARKLHFVFVAGILAAVGSRVASLVVLEFCLRAVSGWVARGMDSLKLLQRLMIQSQFSLGCALGCTLQFLHEGAPHRWLCSLLAAALSCWLARKASALEWHVATLYKLHSSQRYCGICITLLTNGRGPLLLPVLCGILTVTFAMAVVAAVVIINQHFLSATEALRFWTPLTICYSLLVVYMQDEQHDLPANQALLISLAVRLGALMVLMLTVGRWADVLHILVCFLGEASCLIPATDLLNATSSQE
ncbi:transmembrane protein 82 isoform X2 [Hippocampus comes]|uniref:transmembrane protein 82 isoform X2 n=1 Tax=Hippocampus comes TaxID=109280 RepID=UPI00094E7C6B|nr:PREDICTED: transmembrane protein 82 isoform X2 [Hippocampus comes]